MDILTFRTALLIYTHFMLNHLILSLTSSFNLINPLTYNKCLAFLYDLPDLHQQSFFQTTSPQPEKCMDGSPSAKYLWIHTCVWLLYFLIPQTWHCLAQWTGLGQQSTNYHLLKLGKILELKQFTSTLKYFNLAQDFIGHQIWFILVVSCSKHTVSRPRNWLA